MHDAPTCEYCDLPIPAARGASAAEHADELLYCCYGCRLAADIAGGGGDEGRTTWMLTRLGIALFFSMGVMVFSFYLYSQELFVAPESAPALSHTLTGLMRYLCLILATPVVLILGVPMLENAWTQFRAGIVSTDALVVIGVLAAFGLSAWSTLGGGGKTYFETACMILVLVTLGRWLEATGKLQAAKSVANLRALLPDDVVVLRDNKRQTIKTSELAIGDEFEVAAGSRIVADGEIVRGGGDIDEQIITGESHPVHKSIGSAVHAGALNVDGALAVRATAVGDDSTLGRLLALLEEARRARGGYQRLADRIATLFIPFVLICALVAGAVGLRAGGWDAALMHALAVLLIACPCALGIATPTAVWAAFGRAAARGVLFRNGEAIEQLARVRTMCFDKTGTLTTGRPVVDGVQLADHVNGDADRAIATAAALAAGTNHALSAGVLACAADRSVTPLTLDRAQTRPGLGVVGHVSGGAVALGSIALMREAAFEIDPQLQHHADAARSAGKSLACVGANHRVVAVLTFRESLRADAAETIEQLKHAGLNIAVLTGDHAGRAKAIEEMLHVQVHADLRPADKTAFIENVPPADRPVAMVGDGLNDAPALAAADVGVAMGCGADLTRDTATVCLVSDTLALLPWSHALARRTVRTIRVNLFWAFAYNVVGIALAISGKLSPVFAAGAMVASSLLVIGNSLRLGIERDDKTS